MKVAILTLQLVSFSGPRKGVSSIVEKGDFCWSIILITHLHIPLVLPGQISIQATGWRFFSAHIKDLLDYSTLQWKKSCIVSNDLKIGIYKVEKISFLVTAGKYPCSDYIKQTVSTTKRKKISSTWKTLESLLSPLKLI